VYALFLSEHYVRMVISELGFAEGKNFISHVTFCFIGLLDSMKSSQKVEYVLKFVSDSPNLRNSNHYVEIPVFTIQ
jgi:hypothetical protein